MNSICLNMIVKNEAHVIRRCLDSVMPLITSWCILDTGSTDGTQEIIREHLKHIPGELHEAPWKGFGPSRTEAIMLARDRADYLLFIDADDEMILPPGYRLPKLEEDSYYIPRIQGECSFMGRNIVSTRLDWRFVGVLHEYADCGFACQNTVLQGPSLLVRKEGSRSLDPQKYEKDAAILEQALLDEPDNVRYVFYLAQSYKDAGQNEKAIENYRKRAGMGGWEEEVFISLLRIAQLMELLQRPESETVHAYLEAYQYRPQRAEPLECLARFLRGKQKFHLAVMFAETGMSIHKPADFLLVEESCYSWRCLDEFAVSAYWTGRHIDCIKACDRLLSEGRLPDEQRERVSANRKFALKALGA